ncbi:retinol dehydrogenase 11-like isoform X2 [Parasteatoda tepidariorum]
MTAMDMARRNARVLLACRNVEKANKVAEEIKKTTGNQNVFVKVLDLTSFASVRACAKSVLETEEKLHVLINNAGIAGLKNRKLTEDGCENTMQSNHLGHFLLTLLLLDLLKRSSPSRIINVSSEAHRYQRLDIEDLSNKKGLNSIYVYGNTKLANVLFTAELADRLQGSGVTVNSLHPGVVNSDFLTPLDGLYSILMRILFFVVGKTSEEGAQTTIQLAVDPRLEKTTGKYFADCKKKSVTRAARNKLLAKRLFEVSEKIVGESFCKKQ